AQEKKAVKSKVGDKVGLPCCRDISSVKSLSDHRVYWQKNTTEVVLAYAEGSKISKNERYDNRTDMDTGNLTLWISPVEILDNGSYQCVVQNLSSKNPVVICDETVTLFVTADFSKPNITAEVTTSSCESAEMLVRCSAHGGFPKPTISGALNNESAAWNYTQWSESGLSLYNVTAELWVSVTKDINFTCSVEYSGFAKSTTLLLKKTCVVPTVPPTYKVITASSIIIIFLLVVTLAARYLSRYVCSYCCKPQDSVEEGVKECTKPPMSSRVTSETSSV
ncbi:CD80 protein, partial [Bucorvus abyssinicus]|nr:CD80 protein [Bucorvus abyssinicus]